MANVMCNVADLSQGRVVFQKQLQKHVISGPFSPFSQGSCGLTCRIE